MVSIVSHAQTKLLYFFTLYPMWEKCNEYPIRRFDTEYVLRIAQGMEKVRKKVVAPIKKLLQRLLHTDEW